MRSKKNENKKLSQWKKEFSVSFITYIKRTFFEMKEEGFFNPIIEIAHSAHEKSKTKQKSQTHLQKSYTTY